MGKSTLANSLAPSIEATILSSDKIRKELFFKPTYSRYERRLVYDVMILLAKYLHNSGINCILDATFNREYSRVEVKESLRLEDKQFLVVECVCPEELVISRLKARKEDYSDAGISTYRRMKKIYEPVKVKHITINTITSPAENARIILNEIAKK